MRWQGSELSYAVRVRVLLKFLGQLCLMLSAITAVPMGVAAAFGETRMVLRYAVVILLVLAAGISTLRMKEPPSIQNNEAMAVVALFFLFTPLLMAYPMTASGMSYMDALFEAVSGLTTTGLSTRASVENAPRGFLFARSWMQWYGGLGIVIFSLALLVRPGTIAKALAAAQGEDEDLIGGTKFHANRILWVYGIMTTGGILLLLVVGTSPFNAVAYALAAVSTGGFSPHDASMAGLHNPPAAAAVILISLAGAVPLALYHQRYRRGWPFAWNMVQLMAILAIGALTCLLLILFMRQDRPGSISEIAYHASLLAFSAQTTAGFSSIDVAQLAPASKLTLIFSMIVGGGNGSTAGGIKVLRLLIVGRLIHLVVFRTAVSRHAVVHPHLVRRRLEENDMREVLIILSLFFLVVAGSWLPFVACGYDPMNSLFEVVSAVGTVGLSAGITGPELSPLLKGILCLDMLLGRLEILAWLVLLYPGTWFGRRA